MIAVAQAGAGFVDRCWRDLGWGGAAETEAEAVAPSPILAVPMAGLIAGVGSEQVKQELVNRDTIIFLEMYVFFFTELGPQHLHKNHQ